LLRRISDRWLGFKLSGEIQNYFKNLNLSAGRVQTPVLGWILEKEEIIKEKYYLIKAGFSNKTLTFTTEDKDLVNELKRKFKDGDLKIKIEILEKKEENLNPLPPYETGELLKDAFSFFKLTAPETMRLAQELFEQGLITYHRTDSIYISDVGIMTAKEFLEKLNKIDLYKPSHFGAQGTHEAIRPTRALTVDELIEGMVISGERDLTSNH
ncbi:MAG: DNA topoisomerase, partial [Leptonema sp. (in: bacteria)]